MNIWGKLLGAAFGFMLGKIPGAVIGFFLGHYFDRGMGQNFNRGGSFSSLFGQTQSIKDQAIFTQSLFAVLGHIAKADGRVTEEEIRVANHLMDEMRLEGAQRAEAQAMFREGKHDDFPLKVMLTSLSDACGGRRDVLQFFLEILIQASFADGQLSPREQEVLKQVAQLLGFPASHLAFLLRAYEAELRFRGQHRSHQNHQQGSRQQQKAHQPSIEDAYTILGVSASDDDKTIKRAYRKLMSEHHPDKLMAKGLPKEAMELAKQKAQDISSAYELVKQKRGT